MRIKLMFGDCIERMKSIPDKSIDMVLTDPPYGITRCKWDNVIPFDLMWTELKRITKDNGAICLFGTEPFSSHLRLSNLKMFKYDWVWVRNKVSGFMQAKNKPLNTYETVSVFSKASMATNRGVQPKYYPNLEAINVSHTYKGREQFGDRVYRIYTQTKTNYPRNLLTLTFKNEKRFHPTQKLVPLLEYLIKTYTLENETVLDFTMGSGSTGVACKNLNRNFIGIENDQKYFDIAKDRIKNHRKEVSNEN